MHEKDNYLKTAELSTEQNCNMISGVPSTAVATTVLPTEKASIGVSGKPSHNELKTINNPVISIPSAVTLRSWSIRAKFPLLFPYIFFLLIFYPPIVPSRNIRLRFTISIISSCMLRISSGFILERKSRTASTFGILPLIQFFSLFDMLSGVFIF